MARRKSHSKKAGKKHTRRRKISGFNTSMVIDPLAMLAGAVIGNYAKKALKETLTFSGKDYSGAAVMVAGILLPKVSKEPIVKALGNGMIVSGGLSTVAVFMPSFPINGIDMIGYADVPTIGRIDAIGTPMSFQDSENEFGY